MQGHPKSFDLVKIRAKSEEIVQNMCKSSQNFCTCFDFTKMAPKKILFFLIHALI